MPSLGLLALVGAIAILVLIPTRRLFLAGWSTRSLTLYFVGVVALGVVVAELRAPARFLIPILVIAYIAPFVTARAGVRRLFGAQGRGPVVRPVERPGIAPPPEVVGPTDRDAAAARPVTPADAADRDGGAAGEGAGDRGPGGPPPRTPPGAR